MTPLDVLQKYVDENPWDEDINDIRNAINEKIYDFTTDDDLFKSQYDGVKIVEKLREQRNAEFLAKYPEYEIEVNSETGQRFAVAPNGDRYPIDYANSINTDDDTEDDEEESSNETTTEETPTVEDTSLGSPITQKEEEKKQPDATYYIDCPVIGNILLYNYFCKNPYFLNGTITVMGREQYHIGERVKTQDGIEWYVEGVNHSITCYTGNWVTTLSVTRGIPPHFRFTEPVGEWESLTPYHVKDWLCVNDAIIQDSSVMSDNYMTLDISVLDEFIKKLNEQGGMFHDGSGCVEAVVRMGTKLGIPSLTEASKGSNIEDVKSWGGVKDCNELVSFCRERGVNLLNDYDNNKQHIVAGDVVLFPHEEGGYGHVVLADGTGGCYGNSSESYVNGIGVIKHYSDCGESWGSTYPIAILQTGRELSSSGTGSKTTAVSYPNNLEACVAVLKGAGFSLSQTIALCANIQAESGFNSLSIRDGSTTWGLLHWHGMRKDLLMLHTSGRDVYSIEHQLDFMIQKEFTSYKASSKEIIDKITEDEDGLSVSEGASLFFIDFVSPHPEDKQEDLTLIATDLTQRASAIGQIAINITQEITEAYNKVANGNSSSSDSSPSVSDNDNQGTSSNPDIYDEVNDNASTTTNQNSSNSDNKDIFVGDTNLNDYIND